MNRDESGGSGREDVVVDAVADICDLSRWTPGELDHECEEPGVGLAHSEAR
jgi:hypothetical protein